MTVFRVAAPTASATYSATSRGRTTASGVDERRCDLGVGCLLVARLRPRRGEQPADAPVQRAVTEDVLRIARSDEPAASSSSTRAACSGVATGSGPLFAVLTTSPACAGFRPLGIFGRSLRGVCVCPGTWVGVKRL